MKVPLQRNITINTLLKHIKVTTIKIAMEDSKVNVTAGIITNQGFLTIELCIGLLLCAVLCTIIARYQWYSFSWQLQTNKRFQIIHAVEDLIQMMRAMPDEYHSLFPYQKDGIAITMTREIQNTVHLVYLDVVSAAPTSPIHLVVPVTLCRAHA